MRNKTNLDYNQVNSAYFINKFRSIINALDTFIICITKKKRSRVNCTNFVWMQNWLMRSWWQNGKNPDSRIYAAFDAFKREIQISGPIAFAECPNPKLTR